jgi:hypothetical protein
MNRFRLTTKAQQPGLRAQTTNTRKPLRAAPGRVQRAVRRCELLSSMTAELVRVQ